MTVAAATCLALAACGAPKNSRPTLELQRTTTTADDSPPTTGRATGAGAGSPTIPSTDPSPLVAVAPGRYSYSRTGTNHASGTVKGIPFDQTKSVDATWTLTYRKPSGHIQHVEGTGGEIVAQDLSYRSTTAANITSLRYSDSGRMVDFAPNPPARFVPIPVAVGDTWEWSMASVPDKNGNITRRSGSFHATRAEDVTIAGASVRCTVIEGDVTLRGQVTKTMHVTTWYAASLKLVVKEHQLVDYRVTGDNTDLAFHVDQTSVLAATTPT